MSEVPNERDSDLQRMTMQIRTVMERLDGLNERLSAIASPSPPHTRSHPLPVANVQRLQDPAVPPFSLVNTLQQPNLGAREQSMQPISTIEPEMISPEYHGPTSSEFTFEVANESLTELGVGCSITSSNPSTRFLSSPSSFRNQTTDKTLFRRLVSRDPLWAVKRSDAQKYIDAYHNTVGAMYPVIDRPHLIAKVQLLFDALDAARGPRYQGGFGHLVELMYKIDTQIIKIQLAVGMITTRGVTGTETAIELVQSVLDSSDDSLMNTEGLSGVQILVSIVSPLPAPSILLEKTG